VNSDTPEPAHYPEEHLLLYVEDMLAPDEKLQTETHLGACPECARRVMALRDTINRLKKGKEVFCPEPWEIYEFVERGKPEGVISRHVKLCSACLAEVQTYEAGVLPERMPAELWQGVQERITSRGADKRERDGASGFLERLYGLFRFPAMAAAAATAAILVVLALYPREFTEPGVGLSTITWEGALKSKAVQKKAAVLLLFDLEKPLSQKRIDSLYEALKPNMDVSEHFSVIPPAVLSAAIREGELRPRDEMQFLKALRSKFDVSFAVLVELTTSGAEFDIRARIMDTVDDRTLRTISMQGVSGNQLNDKVREVVFGLMLDRT